MSTHSTIAPANSFPTPASSVSGIIKETLQCPENATSLSTEKHTLSDVDAANNDPSLHSSIHPPHPSTSSAGNDHEMMDLDPKNNNDRHQDTSLECLQKDIGTAFHLCKTSYSMSGPNPAFDLVSLYGLGPVAASVARTDPITGEKINRLRKSYEGKIKGMGLSGRNKPVKQEPGAPGSLRSLMMWPDEEWHNQKVVGKEIKVAEPESALYKMQFKAMKMDLSPIPNNEYWEDLLGYEKPSKPPAPSELLSRKVATTQPAANIRNISQINNGSTAVPASALSSESSRPRRVSKKRSYNDSSFVGYGEGFPDDDDMDSSLYSNDDDSGKKKRKKIDHSAGAPSFPERGGSYGVGMFGIGAR
ncbi:hypothetical protein FQN57_005169 [Myotisia sp. PD_48]|nr:hypothetical protein FQN57_005169 [Myotisia sp. PD_48]